MHAVPRSSPPLAARRGAKSSAGYGRKARDGKFPFPHISVVTHVHEGNDYMTQSYTCTDEMPDE